MVFTGPVGECCHHPPLWMRKLSPLLSFSPDILLKVVQPGCHLDSCWSLSEPWLIQPSPAQPNSECKAVFLWRWTGRVAGAALVTKLLGSVSSLYHQGPSCQD